MINNKPILLVKSKDMNHTARGIVDAILTLYPNVTFNQLKDMLPDTINPSAPKNYKSLFIPYDKERLYGVFQPATIIEECNAKGLDASASHFINQNERFITSDKIEILVSRSWETSDTLTGENDIQNLGNQVEQFGIITNKDISYSRKLKGGKYEIYIIDEELYHKRIKQNKSNRNIYLIVSSILVVIVFALLAYFSNRK